MNDTKLFLRNVSIFAEMSCASTRTPAVPPQHIHTPSSVNTDPSRPSSCGRRYGERLAGQFDAFYNLSCCPAVLNAALIYCSTHLRVLASVAQGLLGRQDS